VRRGIIAAVILVGLGVWYSCATRLAVRPPQPLGDAPNVVSEPAPAGAQPDSIYATVLTGGTFGISAVPVVVLVYGDKTLYVLVEGVPRSEPDSMTTGDGYMVLWYKGTPVVDPED